MEEDAIIIIPEQQDGGFVEGCSEITYCMTFANPTENDVNNIEITFTTSSGSATNFSIPVDLGGFTALGGGVFTQTIDVPEAESVTLCISFRIDEAFDESIDFQITADVEIAYPGCKDPELFSYNGVIPNSVAIAADPSGTVELSEIATSEPPFFQGILLTPELSETNGQSVIIRGTLLVDVEEYWFPNSSIYLDEGASIVVQSGSILHFLGGDQPGLIKGCTEMWESIVVEDGGQLEVNAYRILDGLAAVEAQDGSTVSVTECNFVNNRRGIFVAANGGNPNNINLTVSDNSFNAPSLLTPLAGQRGFSGLEVNNLQLPLFIARNNYQNLAFGILSNRSTILTLFDYFQDVDEGINAIGKGHTLLQIGRGKNENQPTFLNCVAGIRAENMNVQAKQNAMLNMGRGIGLRNGTLKNFNLNNNIIQATDFGISVGSYIPSSLGIAHSNAILVDGNTKGSGILSEFNHRCSFEHNNIRLGVAETGIALYANNRVAAHHDTVQLQETQPVSFGIILDTDFAGSANCNIVQGTYSEYQNEQYGIALRLGTTSRVGCNNINSTWAGFGFIDMNAATDLKGNLFNEHEYGIQGGSVPSPVSPSNSFAILNPYQDYAGNAWLGTYENGAWGAYHFGAQFEINASLIEVDPADAPYYDDYNTNDFPSDFVVSLTNGGNTYQCSGGCPPALFQDESVSVTDLRIANNTFTPTPFDNAAIWTARRQLYRRLLETPSLEQEHSSLTTFLNNHDSTTVGIFEQMRQDIESLFSVDSATLAEINRNYDTILVKANALRLVDSLLHENPTTQDSIELEQEKAELLARLDSVLQANLAIDSLLTADRQADASSLATENEGISVSADYETNQKIVNRAMLKMIRFAWSEPDSVSTVQLMEVANQCPFSGGEAVRQARALLDETLSYDDESLCENAQPLVKPHAKTQSPLVFKLHPNPSNNYTIAELLHEVEESGEALVYNAFGQLVLTQPFEKGTSTLLLDFSAQPAGIYYLTLRTKSRSYSQIFTKPK